ncbi:bifunctional 5,10-methylenetetrahydrofolate dehydrogenase/5,10-methenyltetrahydrofolate cyclohydrolase [Candidatus Nomurabacteria bacterium]|nr:bifunctional 5,10-methylenetetrahydrofolate dehydrogenase/5,10-methenyltetrahydrofolate cyclohydrolase [Candidatus Nomurabacteria bacterium]MCB9820349.1 bifunctional 5,10-methylenetetrahydrofolate dehydrogenase/5,10-methenyltetrahydrofolate cyclohydrolase [Candidatus Nomurabacteria bacterium]
MKIDGKKIQQEKLSEIKRQVGELGFTPLFCDVMVGEDLVSRKYVELKEKMAEGVGMGIVECRLPSDVTDEEVVQKIKELNETPNMCGVIVQLPLPAHLDKEKIVNAIDPTLDVDCLTKVNREKFYESQAYFSYPTAIATMDVLASTGVSLEGKNICVLGKGELVGKPIAYLLSQKGYNVQVIDKSTEDKEGIIKDSDVVISATGVASLINAEMIKDGSVIIDVGTSESFGAVVGDVSLDGVAEKASFAALTPGGVGPVTIACLFENVLHAAKFKK